MSSSDKISTSQTSTIPTASTPDDKDLQFFYEDVVTRYNRRIGRLEFGIVREVASTDDFSESEEEEYESEDEEEEEEEGIADRTENNRNSNRREEEDDENEWEDEEYETEEEEEVKPPLGIGEVRVEWDNGEESVEQISNLKLLDRSFLHGDIAARIEDKAKPFFQKGTVVGVSLLVDVLYDKSNGKIANQITSPEEFANIRKKNLAEMNNINAKYLQHPLHIRTGNYAAYEDWLVRADNAYFNLVVKFKDGCTVLIADADPETLLDEMFDYSQPYYVGQIIDFTTAERADVLRESEWTVGNYSKKKHRYGMIIDMSYQSLDLEFITNKKTLNERENDDFIDFSKVKAFHYYNYTKWNVFDRAAIDLKRLLNLGEEDRAKDPENMPNYNEVDKEVATDFSNWVFIIRTKTFVDIVWQDGSKSTMTPATDLYPVQHLNDSDFTPDDFISPKIMEEYDENDPEQVRKMQNEKARIGVVKSVNAEERTCKVRWVDDQNKTLVEEETSIYDILAHSVIAHRLGDVVIRFPKSEDIDNPNFQWVGELIGIHDGVLTVSWINGSISTVRYNEVLNINAVDQDEEENISEEEEKMRETEDLVDAYNEKKQEEEENDEGWETEEEEVPTASDTRADSVKADDTTTSADDVPEYNPESFADEFREFTESFYDPGSIKIGYKRNYKVHDYIPELPPNAVIEEEQISVQNQNNRGLKDHAKYEIATDLDNHFFRAETKSAAKQLAKVLHKECKLLQENLPDGCYVKSSERALDVLRSIILGPAQTPYYMGFYIFDLLLPTNYPTSAPQIHFWSYGLRINPNLYEEGKVCLSLLGTWSGKSESEEWNSKTSNILQVVVSILGLVLVDEPYYNEAGYDKQKGTTEGHHNSKMYNENALLLNIQHMVKTMRQCPEEVITLMKYHFVSKRDQLIEKLKFYLSSEYQYPYNTEKDCKEINEKSVKKNIDDFGLLAEPSAGFKKSLAKLLPLLEQEINKL